MRSNSLSLRGVRNFREVGGFHTNDARRVRGGRVFRSGHLARASDSDFAQLAEKRIRVVVDLRGPSDIALTPPLLSTSRSFSTPEVTRISSSASREKKALRTHAQQGRR